MCSRCRRTGGGCPSGWRRLTCYACRGVLDLLRQVLTIRVQERALRAHYPVPRPACGLWPRCRVCGRFSSGLCCFRYLLLYLTGHAALDVVLYWIRLALGILLCTPHPPNVIHRQEHRSWTGHRPSSGASRRRSALSVQSEGRSRVDSRTHEVNADNAVCIDACQREHFRFCPHSGVSSAIPRKLYWNPVSGFSAAAPAAAS